MPRNAKHTLVSAESNMIREDIRTLRQSFMLCRGASQAPKCGTSALYSFRTETLQLATFKIEEWGGTSRAIYHFMSPYVGS